MLNTCLTCIYHLIPRLFWRIKEFSDQGVQALAWGLSNDDLLEGLLRQLAAAREFRITKDAEAANRILGFRAPGDSIVPGWLQEEARGHSQAIYKQGLRTRPRGGQQQQQQQTQGQPTSSGGKAKGRGRSGGGGRGGQPPAGQNS